MVAHDPGNAVGLSEALRHRRVAAPWCGGLLGTLEIWERVLGIGLPLVDLVLRQFVRADRVRPVSLVAAVSSAIA